MLGIKCKKCGEYEYRIVNSEICNDNLSLKSYICSCSSCNNVVDIIIDRGLFEVIKIKDLGFLPKK